MVEVNVKDARSKLSTLLDRVEQGEEVIITRRGKKVARMIQPLATQSLPSLKDFRASLGGMAPSTMYRHIETEPGFPQPVKVGMLTRFRQSDLDRYLDEISAHAGSNTDGEAA